MEKNTLLAVILSVVVITIGFMVQNALFPSPTQQTGPAPTAQQPPSVPTSDVKPTTVTGDFLPTGAVVGTVVPVEDPTIVPQTIRVDTDLFEATFLSKGAVLTSLRLKEHRDKDGFVDLVKNANPESGAFELAFGGADAKAVDAVFRVRRPSSTVVEFFRDFQIFGYDNSAFTLTKRFTFKPGEHLFEVDVVLANSVNRYLPLNFDNIAYTLRYGPQIGPDFEILDGQYDYRRFIYLVDGKREDKTLTKPESVVIDKTVNWIGILGKYFTVIAAPVFSGHTVTVSTIPPEGEKDTATIAISRPVIRAAGNTDTYRFYAGPKIHAALERYNEQDRNAFGVQEMDFDLAMDANPFLGWLEWVLKFFLQVFYGLVPNWGVAIILVTILVNLALLPLSYKSLTSMSKMQAMAPKLQELKGKYQNDPQRLNQETMELYKKEGVNPMGGCLPMLLQIPIFFAMYGLFSNHFDLRGAEFIRGWISDLSAPESIFSFAPFTIPIFNITFTDLRALPILFVVTQIGSTLFTQNPQTASNQQMKIMMYAMPVIFFFILYNVPSGLLVYWIVTNVLTAARQLYFNAAARKKQSQ